ncbi:MAG: DNA repair protein RadC [Clostridia bacterium]
MNSQEHKNRRARVRKRFLQEGLESFEDHEVLELLLYYSIPMRDTNGLSHKMIARFGSLAGVLEAPQHALINEYNLSEVTTTLISLVAPLSRRYLKDRWGRKVHLGNSDMAGQYVTSLFAGKVDECFYVVCMDAGNKVISAALVQEGTINETPVHPRKIAEEALKHKANSVIVAHNHPGGTLKPSNADKEATKRVKDALKVLTVNLTDHIIVAGMNFYSMAEHGEL